MGKKWLKTKEKIVYTEKTTMRKRKRERKEEREDVMQSIAEKPGVRACEAAIPLLPLMD